MDDTRTRRERSRDKALARFGVSGSKKIQSCGLDIE